MKSIFPISSIRMVSAILPALLALASPSAHGQPEVEAQSGAAPSNESSMLQLNRGISAYHRNAPEAKAILTDLYAKDPGNVPCKYYLGLVHLKEGLAKSSDVQDEASRNEAKDAFRQAKRYFQEVVEQADQAALPIEAYLDLGIAQLGGQEFGEAEMQQAKDAADTLQAYVQTETGQNDRFGYFFLGVAQYRLATQDEKLQGVNKPERRREAQRAFDRAVELAQQEQLDESAFRLFETRIIYYRALLHINAQRYPEAKHDLETVVVRAESEAQTDLGPNATALLEKLEKVEGEEPRPLALDEEGKFYVEGFVNIGNYYDTNVILLGEDTQIQRGIPHEEDYTFGLHAGFDVSRYFDEDDKILGRSLNVGIGGSTYHAWHAHIEEFDLNTYSGRAFVNWEPFDAVPDIFLGVQYDYSYTKLGQDPYISSNRISPVISKIWRDDSGTEPGLGDERARTDIFYSYDDRDYFDPIFDPRLDRDGNYHSVGLVQSFNLVRADRIWKDYYAAGGGDNLPRDYRDAERWARIWLGYTYRNERTQGDEFDLFGNTVRGGLELPLPYRFAFDFTAEFTWDDYSQPNLFDFRRFERFDFIQRYIFGVTRTFIDRGECESMKSLSVKSRAFVELYDQDSNVWDRLSQDLYQFNRQIYGLELLISF